MEGQVFTANQFSVDTHVRLTPSVAAGRWNISARRWGESSRAQTVFNRRGRADSHPHFASYRTANWRNYFHPTSRSFGRGAEMASSL